jgi:membrane associated rhomboid family serine protease
MYIIILAQNYERNEKTIMVQDNKDFTPPPANTNDPWKDNDNIIHLKRKKNNVPPMINLPPATKYLMGVMIIVHVIASYSHFILPILPDNMWWIYNLGFVPFRMTDMVSITPFVPLTPITYAFLHAGWLHLGVNILMLAAFGAGLEKNHSAKIMLLIFFGCSVFAAALHFAFDMQGTNPVIGASGGISGLFGAVLIMLQRSGQLNNQNRLLPIVAVWIGITVLFGFMGGPDGSMIAWIAHIGGFLSGLAFMKFLIQQRH